MNNIKLHQMTAIYAVLLVSFLFFALTGPVSAELSPSQQAVCDSLGGCAEGGSSISGVLATALNILSLVAGTIAVIMIIIAGIKFTTSQGDAGKVSGARNSVIYAIVGIIVVLLSQVIVQFVIKQTEPTPVDESSIILPVDLGYGINVSELTEKKDS